MSKDVKILVTSDFQIVDGHIRAKAAQQLGIPIKMQDIHGNSVGTLTNIGALKKGECFRLLTDSVIRVADGYNRSTKKYSSYRRDDISAFREFKKTTGVIIDFYF